MDKERIAAHAQTSPDTYLLYEILQKLGGIENLLTMILDVREKPVKIETVTDKPEPKAVKPRATVKRKTTTRTPKKG